MQVYAVRHCIQHVCLAWSGQTSPRCLAVSHGTHPILVLLYVMDPGYQHHNISTCPPACVMYLLRLAVVTAYVHRPHSTLSELVSNQLPQAPIGFSTVVFRSACLIR